MGQQPRQEGQNRKINAKCAAEIPFSLSPQRVIQNSELQQGPEGVNVQQKESVASLLGIVIDRLNVISVRTF
jgi:hypothetical protein